MPDQRPRFTLEIPVLHYLRKYLLFHNDWADPIPVSRSRYPSTVLFNLLERNYYRYDDLLGRYTGAVTFSLSQDYAERYGSSMCTESVILFNNTFKELFHVELYGKYDMVERENEKVQQRGSKTERINLIIKDAIAEMAEKYHLDEDDYTYETFRKRLFRYRMSREKKKQAEFARF